MERNHSDQGQGLRTMEECDDIIFENCVKRVGELRTKETLTAEEERELANNIELVRLSCGRI